MSKTSEVEHVGVSIDGEKSTDPSVIPFSMTFSPVYSDSRRWTEIAMYKGRHDALWTWRLHDVLQQPPSQTSQIPMLCTVAVCFDETR